MYVLHVACTGCHVLAAGPDSVEHAEAVTRQVEDLVASMQSAMAPVRRAAARIDEVAEPAMRTSHAALDEMEPPLRSTLAVLAGLRTGTRSLIGALSRRANHMQSNGGNDHGGGEMPAGRDAWGEMQGEPLAAFLSVLNETRRYRVRGRILELLDASGRLLALLEERTLR